VVSIKLVRHIIILYFLPLLAKPNKRARFLMLSLHSAFSVIVTADIRPAFAYGCHMIVLISSLGNSLITAAH
jgi:hypothetical protein